MSLLCDCILPDLCNFFKLKWNSTVPTNHWQDSIENGKVLLGKIKRAKRDALLKGRISGGQTSDWDLTCVFKALSIFDMDKWEKDYIDELKEVRNDKIHISSGKVYYNEKDEIFMKVKKVYDAFGWPKTSVEKIENEELTTEKMKQLKAKLEEEKKAGIF